MIILIPIFRTKCVIHWPVCNPRKWEEKDRKTDSETLGMSDSPTSLRKSLPVPEEGSDEIRP